MCVECEIKQHSGQVWNLQPHTAKDFNVRGLADRIRDLEQLHYVLSQDERTVPKEDMFNRYYTKAPNPPSTPADGYVKAELSVSDDGLVANFNSNQGHHSAHCQYESRLAKSRWVNHLAT